MVAMNERGDEHIRRAADARGGQIDIHMERVRDGERVGGGGRNAQRDGGTLR